MSKTKVEIKNKKASFEYFFLETFTAGLVLTGTEIKSIRDGKASIADAYCVIRESEVFIINMHIAEYTFGNRYNHEPKRDRKLLLGKKEIKKIKAKLIDKGLTVIPTLLFINDKGLAKLAVALAKGKKMYDKRETIKNKDIQREKSRGDAE